jgi:hypothetical protein
MNMNVCWIVCVNIVCNRVRVNIIYVEYVYGTSVLCIYVSCVASLVCSTLNEALAMFVC